MRYPVRIVLALGLGVVASWLGRTISPAPSVAAAAPPLRLTEEEMDLNRRKVPQPVPLPEGLLAAVGPVVNEKPRPGRTKETLWIKGYVVHGSRVNLVLSDGRTLTERDIDRWQVYRNRAMVEGEVVYLEKAKDSPPKGAGMGQISTETHDLLRGDTEVPLSAGTQEKPVVDSPWKSSLDLSTAIQTRPTGI